MPEGSLDNTPQCDTETGICSCKQNVEGQKCDRCKAGHFHIAEENEFGCTPCFCYFHTSECELSGGFVKCKAATTKLQLNGQLIINYTLLSCNQ